MWWLNRTWFQKPLVRKIKDKFQTKIKDDLKTKVIPITYDVRIIFERTTQDYFRFEAAKFK